MVPSSAYQPAGSAPRNDHATPAAWPTGVGAGVAAGVGLAVGAGVGAAVDARCVGAEVAGALDGAWLPQPASVRATVAPRMASLPMVRSMSISLATMSPDGDGVGGTPGGSI